MKLTEIYALPANVDGWRRLPNGNLLHIGTGVTSHIDLAAIGNGALIGSGAEIGDYARIGYGAEIGYGARILDKQVLLKTPLTIQGSRHLAGNYQPGMIQIGCHLHSFEHWAEHVLAIARANGYTKAEGLEYQKIVAFLVANGVPAKAEPRVESLADARSQVQDEQVQ